MCVCVCVGVYMCVYVCVCVGSKTDKGGGWEGKEKRKILRRREDVEKSV